MSKTGTRLGAITLTSAALLGVGGASAWASTPTTSPPTLAAVQQEAAAAITLRVNHLNEAISKVTASKQVGSGSATLDAYLQNDIAPLQALGQKIAGDTTVATAETDSATIFTDYRVLALVLPAARLAATADAIDFTALPSLTASAAKAQARANASNQAALQPLITDLTANINAATNGTSGVVTAILSYTPAEWNANKDLLASGRGSVQAAESDITKARDDVRQIRTVLKPTGPAPAASLPTAS